MERELMFRLEMDILRVMPPPAYKENANPRVKFLEEHRDPKKYAFFSDKPGLHEGYFKVGLENEKRLYDYKYSDFGSRGEMIHVFGEYRLSDTDSIYVKEIIHLPQEEDERYLFLSDPANKDKYYVKYNRNGRFISIGSFRRTGNYGDGFKYSFSNDIFANPEEKIIYPVSAHEKDKNPFFYKDEVVVISGGHRKRRTNKRKNKNRRTKSRRYRRS